MRKEVRLSVLQSEPQGVGWKCKLPGPPLRVATPGPAQHLLFEQAPWRLSGCLFLQKELEI